MAKLTKIEAANHQKAIDFLKKSVLTEDEKDFVFNNYHEGATHINTNAGAFFTPNSLAWDFALEIGTVEREERRVVDLCAGIGGLSYNILRRFPGIKLVCVEINPDYVAIGKKLVPEAEWHCLDVMDLDRILELGFFDVAVSNPPFGAVKSFKNSKAIRYSGAKAEYKVIDIAAEIANSGLFIVPQISSGFKYSGPGMYEKNKTEAVSKFEKQINISLELGSIGLDTTLYQGWKGVNPIVEIVDIDFFDVRRIPFDLFGNKVA